MIKQLNRLASSWGCRCDSEYVDDALDAICDNLPFGVKTEMVEIVPEQSVTGENEGPFCILDEVDLPNANFTIGSKVDVVLNGTKYSCVVKEGSGDVRKYIGNFGLMGNGENTGEPFVIFITDVLTYFWSTELGETITLAIYEEQEIVTQLDPKFVGGVPLYVDGYSRLYFDKDLTKGVTKAEIKDLFINGKNLIIVNGNPAFEGDNYFKITQVVDGYGEDYAEAWTYWAFDHLNIHSTTYYTIEKEVNSGGGGGEQ